MALISKVLKFSEEREESANEVIFVQSTGVGDELSTLPLGGGSGWEHAIAKVVREMARKSRGHISISFSDFVLSSRIVKTGSGTRLALRIVDPYLPSPAAAALSGEAILACK